MHISEGILSAPILAGGAVLTTVGTAIGLKKMDYDRIMSVSLLSATFFVASLIHVPLGPGSVHLLLGGLLGLILGWGAFPAIVVALALQALFFQYTIYRYYNKYLAHSDGPLVLFHNLTTLF